jgi:uncharacterized protein YfbU (UPF0304 family)
MTNKEIIREFSALPSEARREVVDFIAFLRSRYGNEKNESINLDLTKEKFVGMWKDREEMKDSSKFVRELRKSEWAK